MGHPKPSKERLEEIERVYQLSNSYADAAKRLNMPQTTIYQWLNELGPRLYGLTHKKHDRSRTNASKGRIEIEIENGIVMAGSDMHVWPATGMSTATRAYIHFAKMFGKDLKAKVINGDALDFPRISQHPAFEWTDEPSAGEEIEEAQKQLYEIQTAGAPKIPCYWPIGNHDQRYEKYLIANAPELAGIVGTRLKDHFPTWIPCYSLFINNHAGGLVIKHRYKGGIHASHNNALWGGRHIATGHLHSQKIQPISNYNGTIYGTDMGCMADPWGPQFAYLEDNPRNWRSGFAVFTFRDGEMLPPELVQVLEEGRVYFRGEIIEV